MRTFAGKPDHHDGIAIIAFAPFSCAKDAGVRVGDVLMAIDGNTVSEGGEVIFRGHERVHYSHLYTQKRVGDTVKLSLLRCQEQGGLEPLEIDVTLTSGKYLVPR